MHRHLARTAERILTEVQVREIAEVTTAVAKGDLSRKVEAEVQGEILLLKNTINDMVDRLSTFAFQVSKVAREVGTEGTLGGQAEVKNVEGKWKDLTDNVNTMAGAYWAAGFMYMVGVFTDFTRQSYQPGKKHIRRHAGHCSRRHDPTDPSPCAGRDSNSKGYRERYGYPSRCVVSCCQASRKGCRRRWKDGWSSRSRWHYWTLEGDYDRCQHHGEW